MHGLMTSEYLIRKRRKSDKQPAEIIGKVSTCLSLPLCMNNVFLSDG
jgi:hypothetical protein